MTVIAKSITINNTMVKNRIIMPPLVCINWADDEGFETYDRAIHYGKRAKGGTGFIVIEATAISKESRLCDTQLGLWRDAHIPQFQRMAEACHHEGSTVIVQLLHAGMKAIGSTVYSASAVEDENCFEMSLEDIEKVKRDFDSASARAKEAGLDGVELHGAHGYLLSQFTSKKSNKRTDFYGGCLDNRLRLPLDLVEAVRTSAGDDFIIGYRFGVNDPTFEEDFYFARKLEAVGVDLLNVSSGIGAGPISVPDGYPFSLITYMGTELFKAVAIPVACVYGIKEPHQADYLLERGMIDMVAVGRGLLADPEWTHKAITGEAVNICLNCSPKCRYLVDGRSCPRYGD